MKTNAYTLAIDHIHVSESAIEAALEAAKRRVAKTASSQAKVRYAAVAASVVLTGAASAVYFGNIARFEPPVSLSPAAPTVLSTEAVADGTEAVRETTATTETTPAPTERKQETESAEETIRYSATHNAQATEPTAEQKATEKTAPTEAPKAAPTTTVKATEPPPAETPTEPEDVPLPEVDRSLLCADGKLFITIAETGLEHIDDLEAFSDDHLYYIDTKFGRYYKIQPFELKPLIPSWIDQPRSDEMVCLYNSDGEIVGQAPAWW